MSEAWTKVNAQGGKMDDFTFCTIIIVSMPKEWDIVISTLYPKNIEGSYCQPYFI